MDRFLSAFALVGAMLFTLTPGALRAQSSVSSAHCSSGIPCFTVVGRVAFEASEASPTEARIQVRSTFGRSGTVEVLTLRTTAPDFRFEVRLPLSAHGDVRLIDLPTPWLDDGGAKITTQYGEPQRIELRSTRGVPVTATFRFPEGTVAPPPFRVSVRRSPGDLWFTPVEVSTGQLTFLARRDTAYTIAAWPKGFGQVAADFPPQPGPHAVVVDVSKPARPMARQAVLLEGPSSDASAGRRVWLPIALEERSPSGGGPLPYAASMVQGSAGVRLETSDPPTAGRRQRLALAPIWISNDAVAEGPRSATLRLTPNAVDVPAAPDIALTVIDDDDAGRPPVLDVVDTDDGSGAWEENVVSRREGGPGEGWTITLALDKPAPAGGASVLVDTVSRPDVLFRDPLQGMPEYDASVARDFVDFEPVVQRRVSFAAGQRFATLRIEGIGNDRIQPERAFLLAFTDPMGLVPRDPSVEFRIINDEVDNSPAARNDLLPVTPLPRANILDVLANDVLPPNRYSLGRLAVIEPPRFGSVTVETAGTQTPLDDRLVYMPSPGRAGEMDRFRYQLCGPFDEGCVSAEVDVPIRPVPSTDLAIAPAKEAGFKDIGFSGLPSLADARFELLARIPNPIQPFDVWPVAPDATRFSINWSPSFGLPFVEPGQSARRTYLFHLRGTPGSDVDLHVAYDANANGLIERTERLCSSAGTGPAETCLVRFTQTGAGVSHLHVALGNPGPAAVPARLIHGAVDEATVMPGLAATGPTRISVGEAFNVRLSWRNDAVPSATAAIGVLRVRDRAGVELGDVPFVLDLPRRDTRLGAAPRPEPMALRPGVAQDLRVPQAGQARDRVFIDVPPGTGRLTVMLNHWVNSGARIHASLRRMPLPPASPDSSIPAAPAGNAMSINGLLGDTDLILDVASPMPGRWYMVLEDRSEYTFENHVVRASAVLAPVAPAPVIRPGGYFNPSRAGHGLFLYPAAGDWAGLWYTYRQNGEPVWYYLQAAAPGVNGIWSAPIFRSGWNGSRNHLTEVGRATITPTGADAFQFTYVLDGETGSEPFVSFGRGCPGVDGRVVNASGHWFDPTRSGTGYSVQLLPNYEFHAVFAYAPDGTPRFLVAERGSVGGASDTLVLQQLRGFCPLCVRSGFPERADIGTLRREFTNGVLSRIAVDGTFTNGTQGRWTANDAVIPLGGLQGCVVD